ncbi:MAG TPA: transcriptional regulator [Ruminococcaceae bacterium]|nr:transcriptional regulator [Oscillospiraceae bacterium]
MKLVISIVANSDVDKVVSALGNKGFYVTKMSIRGQFLVDGNTTLLSACQDEKVPEIYDIIKKNVSKRIVKSPGVTSNVHGSLLNQSVDVEVGGATAFTVNIEDLVKF